MNLIANAVKFTPFSGKIQVTARLLRSNDDLTIKDPTFMTIMAKNNGKNYLEMQV